MTDREKVINALENPDFDWRTLEGISKETHLDLNTIYQVFGQISDILIQSSVPDEKGNPLYTTRKHYSDTHDFLNQSLSAFTGSVKP